MLYYISLFSFLVVQIKIFNYETVAATETPRLRCNTAAKFSPRMMNDRWEAKRQTNDNNNV
jgi:hypothetical protein